VEKILNLQEAITIVIPTSPIPSHPSNSLIEHTIASIRYHLPDCPMLIQADGVRPEQEKFRKQYEAYLLRMDDGINAGKYGPCKMIRFPEFRHQAAMMKESIGKIETPLLFYLEHDFIMLPEYVDWKGIAAAVISGSVNQIRLYYWSSIIPDHWHLMVDKEPIFICGVPVLRTIQWSQHPQVASVSFYKKMLSHFSDDCRTMIEDRIYPVVTDAPWEDFRCSIYAPMPYLKREAHIHGREEEPKYEGTFTF
jgi:hypothetical protein